MHNCLIWGVIYVGVVVVVAWCHKKLDEKATQEIAKAAHQKEPQIKAATCTPLLSEVEPWKGNEIIVNRYRVSTTETSDGETFIGLHTLSKN
jgi:hypothetical protein